jgi:hypothetical protein
LRKASRRISQLYRSRQRAKAKYALGLQITATIHALLRRHPGHPCEAEHLDGKADASSRGTRVHHSSQSPRLMQRRTQASNHQRATFRAKTGGPIKPEIVFATAAGNI